MGFLKNLCGFFHATAAHRPAKEDDAGKNGLIASAVSYDIPLDRMQRLVSRVPFFALEIDEPLTRQQAIAKSFLQIGMLLSRRGGQCRDVSDKGVYQMMAAHMHELAGDVMRCESGAVRVRREAFDCLSFHSSHFFDAGSFFRQINDARPDMSNVVILKPAQQLIDRLADPLYGLPGAAEQYGEGLEEFGRTLNALGRDLEAVAAKNPAQERSWRPF